MRVLLTTDTVGGVWTFTKELTQGLLEREHAVGLVSFGRMPSREQANWCSSLSEEYPESFRYFPSDAPLEWMPENALAYSTAEPILLRAADEFRPDIFHSSQFCFGAAPMAAPKLITAHSDVLSWARECRPTGLEPSDWLTQYRTLVQHGLAAADAVVAPTRWMLRALSEGFQVTSATRVILNGRSLDECPGEHESTLQAVSCGRLWDEAKNIALLSQVRALFPILVAGEQRLGGATLAIPSNLTFCGKLEQRELLALFRSSRMYLAIPLYEPFGLAPLEAALCGCAVVANDIPSLREVWGDAALFFRGVDELSRILIELASSPEALGSIRWKSRERALRLTRARMVESYLSLYAELLTPMQHSRQDESVAYA